MTVHVQIISKQFSESGAPVWFYLEQETLDTLVALLSHSLQVASNVFTPEMSTSADITQALESHDETQGSPKGVYIKRGGSKQALQLVADILQTASHLMLVRENKHVLVYMYSTCFHICTYLSAVSFFFSEVHLDPQG